MTKRKILQFIEDLNLHYINGCCFDYSSSVFNEVLGVVNLYRVYQSKTSDSIENNEHFYDCLFIHYSKTDNNKLYNYLDAIADKTLFNLFYNEFFYHNKIISASDDWFLNKLVYSYLFLDNNIIKAFHFENEKLDYNFNMYKSVFCVGTSEGKIEEIRNLYKDKFFSKLINKPIDELTEEEKNIIRMYYI